MPKVIEVRTSDQIEEVRCLFREYERFLGVDLCFQGFEEELADIPGKYASPDGALLLAVDDRRAAGCVALRKLADGVCEMKRLFVRPEFRGNGLGRLLAERVIKDATVKGYSIMRLDSLDRLTAAIALYEKLGFRRTEPYYNNPLSGVVYMELDLKKPHAVRPDASTP